MPQFAYRARDAQGSLVEGVLDCPDRAVAIRQIELQKCIPVRIELMGPEAKTAPRDGARVASPTQNLKIPHGQLLGSTEPLAHLLLAGMTPHEARATGINLSGLSRAGRRRSHYDFYNLHGAAVVRIHGTNRRSASIAHTDSDANSSCDHGLLVGRLAVRNQRSDRFPRACSHR